jgi:hypothetical protein
VDGIISTSSTASLVNISKNLHNISFRAKDSNNIWSDWKYLPAPVDRIYNMSVYISGLPVDNVIQAGEDLTVTILSSPGRRAPLVDFHWSEPDYVTTTNPERTLPVPYDNGVNNFNLFLYATDETTDYQYLAATCKAVGKLMVSPGITDTSITSVEETTMYSGTYNVYGIYVNEYEWTSSKDGLLGTTNSVTTRLSVGTHTITVRCKNRFGVWSDLETYGTPIMVTQAETSYQTKVGTATEWEWKTCDYESTDTANVGSEVAWEYEPPEKNGEDKTPQGDEEVFDWDDE